MSDTRKAELKLLEVVRLANTGVLIWDVVGPLLQSAMENGAETVPMEDVEEAAAEAGEDLDALRLAIAEKRAAAG